jgi:beta-galactosidase
MVGPQPKGAPVALAVVAAIVGACSVHRGGGAPPGAGGAAGTGIGTGGQPAGGGAGGAAPGVFVPQGTRRVAALADGWRFLRADVAGAEAAGFDDGAWTAVTVPHTWNALDGENGGDDYYRGAGWYRRHQPVPASESGRRIYLEIDAANIVATAWVNGMQAGQHSGGYARFRFDVTALVTFGADNVIAVQVSNAAGLAVPPLSADYTFFGGIYREARLVSVDPLHLDMDSFGSSGVLGLQRAASRQSASVDLRASVSNAGPQPAPATVEASVLAADGSVAQQASADVTVMAGATADVTVPLTIASPHLWDGVRDPYLYTLRVDLRAGGTVVDSVTEPLGLRFFQFDATAGFALNGAPLNLHGVNRHQDRLDRGWAITAQDHDEDMALIREMGANAIRLAHYQHAQHFYDLADRYGLVVWAEVPLVNSTQAGAFADNAKQQLVELIRQSGNHPAIVTWSLSNELQYDKSVANTLLPLMTDMNTLAHTEDPSRPTALATFYDQNDPVTTKTDLVAFNRYDGWYVNTIADFAPGIDGMHTGKPAMKMGLSEYGAGASVNFHSASPRIMDHTEEYQSLFHETYWQALAARPFVWGSFVWNMFDFAADARNEGDTPGRNDKGLVTYDRKTRKDAFYWFKANWTTAPFVYVTSRRWTPRPAGAYDVKVYSNAATVTLRVNGTALPAQTAPGHLFVWKGVALAAGANSLEASAAAAGGATVTDAVTIMGQ